MGINSTRILEGLPVYSEDLSDKDVEFLEQNTEHLDTGTYVVEDFTKRDFKWVKENPNKGFVLEGCGYLIFSGKIIFRDNY